VDEDAKASAPGVVTATAIRVGVAGIETSDFIRVKELQRHLLRVPRKQFQPLRPQA
jgi:hypothetical protein